MTLRTVHLAVYDTLADWEFGFATAGLSQSLGHREPGRFRVRTVAGGPGPITTIGGLRVLPDLMLADLRPEDSAMLILPGNDLWPTEAFRPWARLAGDFLAAGVPVAAICGSTGGLALAGLLDDRAHTSNAAEFLAGLGYGGAPLYREEPAVTDRDLITAGAQAPVEFAREIFRRLDVYRPEALEGWYRLYGQQDPAGYHQLISA